MSLIHPTATICSTVSLPCTAVVGQQAQIGPNCTIAHYAVVGAFTTLGEECHVHSFAVVGGVAQDRRTGPGDSHALVCGSHNVFREGVTISRGTAHGGGVTKIGDHNLFMANSHVGHDCRIGNHNTFANGVSLAGHVQVGHNATLGGHAGVHQFCRIGDLAFIAANAMVNRDVPPYCIAAGDRAVLRGLNVTGLKRNAYEHLERIALKRAYDQIFANRGDAAEILATLATHELETVRLFARFVTESVRGLIRPRRKR